MSTDVPGVPFKTSEVLDGTSHCEPPRDRITTGAKGTTDSVVEAVTLATGIFWLVSSVTTTLSWYAPGGSLPTG